LFKTLKTFKPFNPNSAVAVGAKSEERTFHSEANGLLSLSGQHTSVLCLCSQIPYAGEEKESAPDLIRGGGWNDLNYLNDLNARNLDRLCRARAALKK
jgi:hypothetical protein